MGGLSARPFFCVGETLAKRVFSGTILVVLFWFRYVFRADNFLQNTFRRGAAVAQGTVNPLVVGSNPTAGAKKKPPPFWGWFFFALRRVG